MLSFIRFLNSYWRKILCHYWLFKVRVTARSAGRCLYIGGACSVNRNTVLGDHVSTNGLVVKGSGSVDIGDYVHTGDQLLIMTSNHNYKNSTLLPYDEMHENKHVSIGRAVWIGDRVVILGGVSIGEGAIIQAGSVVVSDIPQLAIAGGSPAKVFSQRDSDKYWTLVENNRFLRVR